jgi:5-formyltetrahydrofolate cyclo-ligase
MRNPRKDSLRTELLKARRALSTDTRQQQSDVIQQRVLSLPAWLGAKTIGIYLSLPDEVSTYFLFQAAQTSGKTLAVPRLDRLRHRLEFHHYLGKSDLSPGPLGILQPTTLNLIDPKNLDAIILPGVGFDLLCNRLGFGGGYFDRFLADYAGHTLGLAFEVQIVVVIPTEVFDRRVDQVVTESRFLSIGS